MITQIRCLIMLTFALFLRFFCFPTLIITTNVTRVNMIDDSFGGDAAVVEYDVLIDFHTFLVGFVEAGMTLECAVA